MISSSTTRPLCDVATVVRGVTFDKHESAIEQRDGYLPILRAGNIQESIDTDRDLIWVPRKRVSSNQIMQAGDIAICMSSGSQSVVGKSALLRYDWKGGVGAFCALVRPNSDFVLPEYLAFFLGSEQFRIWTRQSSGANIKNVRKSELEAFCVPVPSLPEQRRIVDILSRAESIVRLRGEAQKKAAELIPALFTDLFGDPATNPKGWPMSTIGEEIESADYGSSTKASSEGAGLPLIRMGNVTISGDLNLGDLKYVELSPKETEQYRLRVGDIIFNRTNSKELVGKTGLWDGEIDALVASYFIRLRVKLHSLNPHYLWAFMNSAHMKRMLFDTARGAIGQANINSKELKAFRIAVPPIDLQNQFENHCRDVSGIHSQQATATTQAEATFNALLAQVFSDS